MLQNLRQGLELNNETGVLRRTGPGFRTPSEFAMEHLGYVTWSCEYLCDQTYYCTHDYAEFYSIIQILEGRMEVFTAGKTYIIEKNEAVLLDFRQEHVYRCLDDTMVKWELIINGDLVKSYYDMITETWGHKFRASGTAAVVLKKLRSELEHTLPQDHKIGYMLQQLFYEIIEQHKGDLSPEISRAIKYIYDNFEKELRTETIAQTVSLSRSYFSKLFLKETGYTPRDYILNVRINAAQDMLLRENKLSVQAVAENCGFANASHFCRLFKQKTGKSPKAFRDILLGI